MAYRTTEAVEHVNALTRRWLATLDGASSVASGLGVWPLLAFLADAAGGPGRAELAEALGVPAGDAAEAARVRPGRPRLDAVGGDGAGAVDEGVLPIDPAWLAKVPLGDARRTDRRGGRRPGSGWTRGPRSTRGAWSRRIPLGWTRGRCWRSPERCASRRSGPTVRHRPGWGSGGGPSAARRATSCPGPPRPGGRGGRGDAAGADDDAGPSWAAEMSTCAWCWGRSRRRRARCWPRASAWSGGSPLSDGRPACARASGTGCGDRGAGGVRPGDMLTASDGRFRIAADHDLMDRRRCLRVEAVSEPARATSRG